ncbi:hypothetical protein FACS1894201_11620 [Bacteroidia bacterium]|nr:hypothetical protein FACS1894201_11620 [Bacteroidia bacterium]
MATIVSSSDFRTRLDAMFDLADTGEPIFIKRGYKQLYCLAPVESAAVNVVEDDDDPDQTDEEVEAYFTPAMRAEINRRHEAYLSGKAKVITCRTATDLETFLDSL